MESNLAVKKIEEQSPTLSEALVTCSECIMDSTIQGFEIQENGKCNFCNVHDELAQIYPRGEEGKQIWNEILEKIKKVGKGRKYDCVIGCSGGRDSCYSLYAAKEIWGLRPLAVHFNNGFGNPITGDNIQRVTKKLGIDLVTVTSDWRETKDLRKAFLKASTPDNQVETDLGIAAALYGSAAKHNVKYILIGQSFRTEGISPLTWNFLDGRYLKTIHKKFGTHPLRPWKANDPGFNLELHHIFYYSFIKGIKVATPLYYMDYIKKDVDVVLKSELDWKDPGAHYFDDLYQTVVNFVYRNKFKVDRRKQEYSAQIRDGQITIEEGLELLKLPSEIDSPDNLKLCLKRLGIKEEEFHEYIAQPPKTFRDYKTSYNIIRMLRFPIWLAAKMRIIPSSAYLKYFNCG